MHRARSLLLPFAVAMAFSLHFGTPVQAQAPTLAQAPLPGVTAADHVIGNPQAPVTVIEYGSLVCPQCAQWQMSTWYDFKTRLIDTGQVRFVFREVLTEPVDMAATAAAVARCSSREAYFEVIHTLYRWQSTARNFGPVSEWYDRAIAISGRPHEEMVACVNNPETLAAIQRVMAGGVAAGVVKTPTFFINGAIADDHSLEGLTSSIHAASLRDRTGLPR